MWSESDQRHHPDFSHRSHSGGQPARPPVTTRSVVARSRPRARSCGVPPHRQGASPATRRPAGVLDRGAPAAPPVGNRGQGSAPPGFRAPDRLSASQKRERTTSKPRAPTRPQRAAQRAHRPAHRHRTSRSGSTTGRSSGPGSAGGPCRPSSAPPCGRPAPAPPAESPSRLPHHPSELQPLCKPPRRPSAVRQPPRTPTPTTSHDGLSTGPDRPSRTKPTGAQRVPQ